MKISVITVVYNGAKTIGDAIDSILGQTHKDIEYIVIDGASKDNTMDIVRSYGNRISKVVSEPDKGIYDAMNKGIRLATGGVVAILNSDDMYADTTVLERVAQKFEKDSELGCTYGDLDYVAQNDTSKVVRAWRSREYRPGLFKKGWMPAHPTLFVRKGVYDKYGSFIVKLGISADYEIMLRLLEKERVKSAYIPHVMVKMRTGGHSNRSLKQIIKGNLEVLKSWKINGMRVPYSIFFKKPLSKLKQFVAK